MIGKELTFRTRTGVRALSHDGESRDASTASEKVLIVDDDDATREGLKRMLTGAGYTAVTAPTFQDGIQALQTAKPDLLIVDVRLGEYNGLQLVITAGRAIPAIVLTGYDDPVLAGDAHQEGAEYLLKPVDPSALLLVMRRMLSGSQPVS
jgi:DNA-binding response OmpR family regulator